MTEDAITYEESQKKQKIDRQMRKAILSVTLGTIVYALGVVWILQLGGFVSGGVTGISQLIVGLIKKFGGNVAVEEYLGLLIGLLNVPLLVIGWRGVSKHFAVLTVISIVLQTLLITVLTHFTVSPFIYFMHSTSSTDSSVSKGLVDIFTGDSFNIIKNAETSALQSTFKHDMTAGVRLMLSIIGGLVTGVGSAFCLMGGGSTGGLDIISNYLVMKKRKPFTKFQFAMDFSIIISSSLISIESVLYTIVRLIIYMKVLQALYQTYQTLRIEIITEKALEIKEELLKTFYHSMTIYDAVGGFTNQNKKVIEVYAMNFEIPEYISIINRVDPKSFVVITKVKTIRGNYVQRTVI